MMLFKYLLIMMLAILLSNIINRFVKVISVPIIQIILGTGIAFIPLEFHIEFEPELFFVLLVAPLVFYSTVESDKESTWKFKGTILSLAFGLVFASVLLGGVLVNYFMPEIPFAAACTLIAALAPTDDVSVVSLANKFNIPKNLSNILQSEAIFNDASGIVTFQVAMAAMVTGSFYPMETVGKFILVVFGGIVLGIVFTIIKYSLVKWLRFLGLEDVTLHIMIQLLSPFLVYIIAESIEVSGIIAVFTTGVTHAFSKKKMNPDNAIINIASSSVWNMLTFTLNGLVFLILGIQLPEIIKTINSGIYLISNLEIIMYIVSITVFLGVMRFLWSYILIHKKVYMKTDNIMDKEDEISKFKASLIISLAGAKGTITMATVLSIPIFLDNGEVFPERDLLIIISTGVILCSLIISYFILPLFVDKKEEELASEKEVEASIKILKNVIESLNREITVENRVVIKKVTDSYYKRILSLKDKHNMADCEVHERKKFLLMIAEWEKENTRLLLKNNEIDVETAEHFLDMVEHNFIEMKGARNSFYIYVVHTLRTMKHIFKFSFKGKTWHENHKSYKKLRYKNNKVVLEKIRQMKETGLDKEFLKAIEMYEMSPFFQRLNDRKQNDRDIAETDMDINEAVALGLQFERDNIQLMLEKGKISKETSRGMRKNISILEAQLEIEEG